MHKADYDATLPKYRMKMAILQWRCQEELPKYAWSWEMHQQHIQATWFGPIGSIQLSDADRCGVGQRGARTYK